MEVTNLNDSGSGSFRACAEGSGARTCIFRVGGTIMMQSPIQISSPNITVAGQSAPGGGILLSGQNDPGEGLMIHTHDVVVRYIRVRMGLNSARPPGSQSGSPIWLGNGDVYNVVVDHCSFSWTTDENVTFWMNTPGVANRKISIQWSTIGEGLSGHSTDLITGSSVGLFNQETDIDIHHNFWADSSHRRPLLKNTSTRLVNNVIYNSGFYSTQALGGITLDVIGNLYREGSMVDGVHEIQLSEVSSGDGPSGAPSVYLAGNKGWNQQNSLGDQWLMAARVSGENGGETGPATGFQRSSAMAAETFPIQADDVNNLESLLLPATAAQPVGASQGLNCTGNWVINRDAVDARLVSEYNAGTGSVPTGQPVFPTIAAGTPCAESLHDGIPDAWKIAKQLITTDAGLYKTIAANGFTYLENYLNGTDPNTLVTAQVWKPAAERLRRTLVNVASGLWMGRPFFGLSMIENLCSRSRPNC